MNAGLSDLALRSRVARMVPLLGSDQDGEVVATARAIGRTLATAGFYWHDAARAIGDSPAEPQERCARSSAGTEPPESAGLSQRQRLAWLDLLRQADDLTSPFETALVANLWAALLRNPAGNRVSPRQRLVVDELIARAVAHGRRP